MTSAKVLPVGLGPRPFRVRDGLEAGVGRERLRRADLRAPVHGVRVVADRRGDEDLLDALQVVMRADQHFSHTTAARLWGAPLPPGPAERHVHVTTIGDGSRMRRRGVTGHRSASGSVVRLGGHPVSSAAATWFACASLVGVRALVAIGDHLVGASGAATIDDLADAVVPGSRAVQRARQALTLVRVGSESPMETEFRLTVVEAGFPEPELNVDVRDQDGRFLGRVDMAWPEYRIALEYDGDHHRERAVFQHDQRRDNGFVVNDWLVVHATAIDAVRPADVLERLRQAFARRR